MRRLLALLVVIVGLLPNRVSAAKTNFCPTLAAALKQADAKLDEDLALNDDAKYADNRTLARLYYRCSREHRGSFGSDFAVLFYATALALSADCSAHPTECGGNAAVASAALNELAGDTRFPYIGKLALQARNSTRAIIAP